jgi:hypothetical protein
MWPWLYLLVLTACASATALEPRHCAGHSGRCKAAGSVGQQFVQTLAFAATGHARNGAFCERASAWTCAVRGQQCFHVTCGQTFARSMRTCQLKRGVRLSLRSSSSGLPPDDNLDDATLRAAMEASDDASDAAAAAAAADYAARFNKTRPSVLHPEGLPKDSKFRAIDGAQNIGMMDNGEADNIEFDSGMPGEIVRVVLAVCRATRITVHSLPLCAPQPVPLRRSPDSSLFSRLCSPTRPCLQSTTSLSTSWHWRCVLLPACVHVCMTSGVPRQCAC